MGRLIRKTRKKVPLLAEVVSDVTVGVRVRVLRFGDGRMAVNVDGPMEFARTIMPFANAVDAGVFAGRIMAESEIAIGSMLHESALGQAEGDCE